MNTSQFMGLDYQYWTLICLAVAVFYFFLWPRPSAYTNRSRWQHVVLRYFHTLVWVLLGAASLLRTSVTTKVLLLLSDGLLVIALLTYLIFIFTFLREKKNLHRRGQ